MENTVSVINTRNNQVIATKVELAQSFFRRLKGLMFRKMLVRGEGMYLAPCRDIHMFFMKFPLTLIFLNKQLQVVEIVPEIKPWKTYGPVKGAYSVIELSVNSDVSELISLGDKLELRPTTE